MKAITVMGGKQTKYSNLKLDQIAIDFPVDYVEHLIKIILKNRVYPDNFHEIIKKITTISEYEKLGFKLAIEAVELDDTKMLDDIELYFSGLTNSECDELIEIARKRGKQKSIDYFQGI